MQIKTIMRYFTTSRLAKIKKTDDYNGGEDVKKLEPSYPVGGHIKWCSHFGKQHSRFLKS